jgi:hypothetical protein
MDHFVWTVSISHDTKFFNFFEIEKYFKDSLISCGIHPEFRQLLETVRAIELESNNNVLSTVYNLTTNTLTKTHRIPNGDIIAKMFDAFFKTNNDKFISLTNNGIQISTLVKKNVQTDQDKVNQTLKQLPTFSTSSNSLLCNIIPLHIEHTEYGTIYIKQDYIEIWFNDGHIDFIRNLSPDLYDNLYYKIYKAGIDSFRFAFPRSYDYETAPQYISLACPTGVCGVSCLQDSIDTEYLKQYINEVLLIITEWESVTTLFPDDPIRFENRIKDNIGYYYIFLGTNRSLTKTQFINLQIEYLSQLVDYLDICSIDKNIILQYARTTLL